MPSLNQRRKPLNQISACLQRLSGNMLPVADVHSLCSPGVTIISETGRVVYWPTSNPAVVTTLKTEHSILHVLMHTGLMTSVCIVWQVTCLNGPLPCFMKVLTTSSTI